MPCLNQDILFDIGKEFVENGNPLAVIRFALSGRESLNAMKKVFVSVTTFKIGEDCYEIELVTFSSKCASYILGNFMETLTSLASSLKHVTITNSKLTSTFRHAFNLQSLTVLNSDARHIQLFCCKTESLEISYSSAYKSDSYWTIPKDVSPYLFSIKKLIVNEGELISARTYPNAPTLTVNDLHGIMKNFISLESLVYNINHPIFGLISVNKIIRCFTTFANTATEIPLKATYSFMDVERLGWRPAIIDGFKQSNPDFVCDETNSDFSCFRKLVQSASTQSTIFEVHFYQK